MEKGERERVKHRRGKVKRAEFSIKNDSILIWPIDFHCTCSLPLHRYLRLYILVVGEIRFWVNSFAAAELCRVLSYGEFIRFEKCHRVEIYLLVFYVFVQVC